MNLSIRPGLQPWLARLLLVAAWLLPQTRIARLLFWLAFVLIRFWLGRPTHHSHNDRRNPLL